MTYVQTGTISTIFYRYMIQNTQYAVHVISHVVLFA